MSDVDVELLSTAEINELFLRRASLFPDINTYCAYSPTHMEFVVRMEHRDMSDMAKTFHVHFPCGLEKSTQDVIDELWNKLMVNRKELCDVVDKLRSEAFCETVV